MPKAKQRTTSTSTSTRVHLSGQTRPGQTKFLDHLISRTRTTSSGDSTTKSASEGSIPVTDPQPFERETVERWRPSTTKRRR